MPEPAAQPEEHQRSVGEVVNGRRPDGTFAPGHNGSPRGPDKAPRRNVVQAILLQALAAEQARGKGKSKQMVKAAAMDGDALGIGRTAGHVRILPRFTRSMASQTRSKSDRA
jgi:hypothetical protein